jgi:two-component system, NtrC family, response regulator HupR/HoxA
MTEELSPRQRAPRRRARLTCALQLGTRELAGYSVNVSRSGLHVRLAPGHTAPADLVPGASLAVRLLLPEPARPLEAQAQVVWVDPKDQDASGLAAVGLGLRFSPLGAAAAARLDAFLRDFRFTVLIADVDPAARELARRIVEPDRVAIVCAAREEALVALEQQEVGVLLCGPTLADGDGWSLLREISARFPRSHLVRLYSAPPDDALALLGFAGAGEVFHVLRRPFREAEVEQVLRRALESYALGVEHERLSSELERTHQRLFRENIYLRQRLQVLEGFEHLVGQSEQLRQALGELERIQRTEATVHLLGETGTGKELAARALHFGGPRAKGPFVAQNCGGLSDSLLHSTLFGHRRGAFTGADRDFPGVFEQAQGGTLFLDEVAELSPSVQGALLRALQEREVTPLGATRPVKVDVRLVSATHKDLREEVRAGRFREDLYFRLVVIAVRLPPLRERRGDLPLLARHFLGLLAQRYGRPLRDFQAKTLAALERYGWPGNVRELENEVERMVILAEGQTELTFEQLPAHLRQALAPPQASSAPWYLPPPGASYDQALQGLERALIDRALGQAQGNVTRAAELLGVERSRLSKLRKRLTGP